MKIKDWIKSHNQGTYINCAVSAWNTGWSAYLTTSERVCREEYGFADDVEDPDLYETLDLKTQSWASVRRLNRVLNKINSGELDI